VLELLAAELPAPAGGAFTTRSGGVSAAPYDALNLGMHVEDEWRRVHANRSLLAGAAGLPERDLVFAQQVHGAGVAVVDRSSSRGRNGGVAAVDALVTAEPGLGLVVLAADCLPVLLADPAAGVVGAAHAGRQGLAAGVLQAALEAMQALGARPAAPPPCSARRRAAAATRCRRSWRSRWRPPSRAAARPPARGTDSVDLTAGATACCAPPGLTDVRAVGGCTLEQPERFFSYRRDGRTGRHAGVVWLRP
jgi:YfiH family protein